MKLLRSIVGPSAVMAAGSMGAGAVTSLLLTGTWFQYSLLWLIVIIAPFFVISVNTSSRIGALNPERGLMTLIREEIHPLVGWAILFINIPLHFLVIMGQMSVMTSALASLPGTWSIGAGGQSSEMLLSVAMALGIFILILSKGYDRMQKIMTGLMIIMLICFVIIALRGFQQFGQILLGFIPSIPTDVVVEGGQKVRSSSVSMLGIIGSAIAPGALLGMAYFVADSGAGEDNLEQDLKSTIINLGVIFSVYAVLIMIAAGFALYPLENSSSIETVAAVGQVFSGAFIPALSSAGPIIFSISLLIAAMTTVIVTAQVTTYIALDGIGRPWRFDRSNRLFLGLMMFFLLGPAIAAPFWEVPALLKVVLLMGANLIVIPLIIVAVLYLSNKKAVMGAHRSGAIRNLVMVALLALSIITSFSKLPAYLEGLSALL